MKKIKFGKRRGEKRLKDREPKLVENVKQAFFARANKTSEISSSFLTDLVNISYPFIHSLICIPFIVLPEEALRSQVWCPHEGAALRGRQ